MPAFPPPLLASRPPVQQVVVATVPAILFGIVLGVVLDLSAALYGVLVLVAVIGGVGAGFEHASAAEGAERGLVSGLAFGAGVLLGHHLLGQRAKASLPHPEALELIVTSLASVPLGALGGWLRSRRPRSDAGPVVPDTT